jgi:hypothetical protein
LLALCAVLAFALAGCGGVAGIGGGSGTEAPGGDGKALPPSATHKLYAIDTYWSGMPYVPFPERTLYEFDLTSKDWQLCPPESEAKDPFRFKITHVEDGYIEIKTNWQMSTSEGGAIDLSSDMTKFRVQDGVMLSLVTPTTDGGTVVEFYYQSADLPEPVTYANPEIAGTAQELSENSELGDVALLEKNADGHYSSDYDYYQEGWNTKTVHNDSGAVVGTANYTGVPDNTAQQMIWSIQLLDGKGASVFGLTTGGSADGITETMAAHGYEELFLEPDDPAYMRVFDGGTYRQFVKDGIQIGLLVWDEYHQLLDIEIMPVYLTNAERTLTDEDLAEAERISENSNIDVKLFERSAYGWPVPLDAFVENPTIYNHNDDRPLLDEGGAMIGVVYYRSFLAAGHEERVNTATHFALTAGGDVFGVGIGDPMESATPALAAYGYAAADGADTRTVRGALAEGGYAAEVFTKGGIYVAFLAAQGEEERVDKILVWAEEPVIVDEWGYEYE